MAKVELRAFILFFQRRFFLFFRGGKSRLSGLRTQLNCLFVQPHIVHVGDFIISWPNEYGQSYC